MSGATVPLWIDTDVALGARSGDVDDGFALAALFGAARNRSVRILGVSTVFGNTGPRESARCTRAIAAASGVDIEPIAGASRKGEASAAADGIAGMPAGSELLCLGPLTNVAQACANDEGLLERTTLRVVGGNLSSRGFLPPLWPYEFNLARDRGAAVRVLARPWRRLVLYPLDVVRRLTAEAGLLSELSHASPAGRLLAEGSRRWLARARRLRFSSSFPLWDVVAALDVLGRLDGTVERRHLGPAMRRYLRLETPLLCLVDFDPARARRALVEWIGESRAVAP